MSDIKRMYKSRLISFEYRIRFTSDRAPEVIRVQASTINAGYRKVINARAGFKDEIAAIEFSQRLS